jgi:hypothetical protein
VFYDKDMTIIKAQNFLASRSLSGSHLCPTCDDVEYCDDAIGIAEAMLMDKFNGDGVIGFSVINMKCNDDAFMLIGRTFYDGVLEGQLFHDGYEHFYADTELGRLAKSLGKFAVCADAKMLNYHPAGGYGEDVTHKHRRAEKLDHDRTVYDSRVLHGQIR